MFHFYRGSLIRYRSKNVDEAKMCENLLWLETEKIFVDELRRNDLAVNENARVKNVNFYLEMLMWCPVKLSSSKPLENVKRKTLRNKKKNSFALMFDQNEELYPCGCRSHGSLTLSRWWSFEQCTNDLRSSINWNGRKADIDWEWFSLFLSSNFV